MQLIRRNMFDIQSPAPVGSLALCHSAVSKMQPICSAKSARSSLGLNVNVTRGCHCSHTADGFSF